MKITILLPEFNEKYGSKLLNSTIKSLESNGIKNPKIIRVPGALELPFAALKEIKNNKPNVLIALGVVIQGETDHYEHVCTQTFRGLMDVQLQTETPIVFGVLTCKTENQAVDRIENGKWFAETAIKMARI